MPKTEPGNGCPKKGSALRDWDTQDIFESRDTERFAPDKLPSTCVVRNTLLGKIGGVVCALVSIGFRCHCHTWNSKDIFNRF
jgi:hypothetical protein